VRNHRIARSRGEDLQGGLIITGATSLPMNIVRALDDNNIPCIAVSAIVRAADAAGARGAAVRRRLCAVCRQNNEKTMLTFAVLTRITEFTRKMDTSDPCVRVPC
jgi:hypothetical protein